MHYHHTRNPRTILMSLKAWLNKLRTKARPSQSNPPRRPSVYRPFLEPLEPRLVLATRIWSGGDPLSSNWSAYLNWSNGALFPDPAVKKGDSVEFPTNANRLLPFVDIWHQQDPLAAIVHDVPIDGGGYGIGGGLIHYGGQLTTAAG